jgi:hypothetical protein
MTGTDRAVAFAEKLLVLLDGGQSRKTATYKFAVLLALVDLCMEQVESDGSAPTSITTRQLAEKVLEIYWPQARAYPEGGGIVLRQNSTGQAEILTEIHRYIERLRADRSLSLLRARHLDGDRYERLVRRIEWKLIEMPLPRLQMLRNRGTTDEFLYRIHWDTRIRRSDIDESFDNRLLLVDGAGDLLVRFAPLLRPLVQRRWAEHVAGWNDLQLRGVDLEVFLFGRERVSLEPVRRHLLDLQDNRCFYCEGGLKAAHVDHFVPWSRHPDDAIDNLVAAHEKCNAYKSDLLADAQHVERWVLRQRSRSGDLDEIARTARWERQAERTLSVARAIYLRLPDNALLWRRSDELVPADIGRLRRILSATSESRARLRP